MSEKNKVVAEKVARDAFGNKPESEAGKINAAFARLSNPISVKGLAEKVELEPGRVRNHVYYLKARGFAKKVGKEWVLANKPAKKAKAKKSKVPVEAKANASPDVAAAM